MTIVFCFVSVLSYSQTIYFSDSSIITKKVILVNDWFELDSTFKYEPIDTTVGRDEIKINQCLVFNGEIIALGNVNKKGLPHGWWFIQSDSEHYEYACWGKFKNGVKKGKWHSNFGYFIVYKSGRKPLVGSNPWSVR